MKLGGIVAMLLGIVFTLTGAYGLAGGGIGFSINERVVGAQEQSIIGIIVLLGGIAMTYFVFKLSRLTVLSIVLELCSLIIPAILLGTGINLVAYIVPLVFGYSFVATVFLWCARARKVSVFVPVGISEFCIISLLITIIENFQLLNIHTPQIGLHIFLISIILGMLYYAWRGAI